MNMEGLSPAKEKLPPTKRSLPINVSVAALGVIGVYGLVERPLPRLDQVVPSHLATPLETTFPELANEPPTKTSLPRRAMAETVPGVPVPKLDQFAPSHFAI